MDKKEELKKIFAGNKPVFDIISNWLSARLDYSLHVKYEPSSKDAKRHFDAIRNDVNESAQKLEDSLKTQSLAEEIIAKIPLIEGLEGIFLGSEEETKKEIEHRKKLKEQRENKSHIDKNNKNNR